MTLSLICFTFDNCTGRAMLITPEIAGAGIYGPYQHQIMKIPSSPRFLCLRIGRCNWCTFSFPLSTTLTKVRYCAPIAPLTSCILFMHFMFVEPSQESLCIVAPAGARRSFPWIFWKPRALIYILFTIIDWNHPYLALWFGSEALF